LIEERTTRVSWLHRGGYLEVSAVILEPGKGRDIPKSKVA
jgi:hypothetical protein